MGDNKKLFFVADSDFQFEPINSCDSALLAMLPVAMYHKLPIHINGNISETLFYFINNDIQIILQRVIPKLKSINISVRGFYNKFFESKKTALAFSGGVDSFASLLQLEDRNKSPFNVTDLVLVNAGAIGPFNSEYTGLVYDAMKIKYSNISKDFDKNFIGINTNIDEFYNSELNFQQTHTIRNIAASLILDGHIKQLFYSSGTDIYSRISLRPYRTTAIVEPILIPLLSSESIRFFNIGSQYSRMDKIKKIIEDPRVMNNLFVCVAPPMIKLKNNLENCNCCWKCEQTMLSIDQFSKLNNFANVFDIARYYKVKEKIIKRMIIRAKEQHYEAEELIRFLKKK